MSLREPVNADGYGHMSANRRSRRGAGCMWNKITLVKVQPWSVCNSGTAEFKEDGALLAQKSERTGRIQHKGR
jgi:hypothetical protein